MDEELNGQGWNSTKVIFGKRVVTCDSWDGFTSFISQKLADFDTYIFRGHAKENWKLEPTIDRLLSDKSRFKPNAKRRKEHLEKFKYATRGRRGSTPKADMSENDWWALGQHHGLLTPLLDWSESPFVAAYFAYLPEDEVEHDGYIVVWALSRSASERKNSFISINKKNNKTNNLDCIEFIRPLTDENQRLISQRGLFTRAPDHLTVEDWIHNNFSENKSNGACLLKILIPGHDRIKAMKSLNRMNVNHLSLFPDLDGASKHCNTTLMIQKYG